MSTRLPGRNPGTVFGLGSAAHAAGERYAADTGRAFSGLPDAGEIAAMSSTDVVVCMASELTTSLLRTLYVPRGGIGSAPGLIFAADEEALVTVCRRQAERLARSRAGKRGRVFINSDDVGGPVATDGDVRTGGSVSHDELLRLLGSDSALLCLTGHSDGIDMMASLHSFLCPYTDGLGPSSDEPGLPPCRLAARCTRFPTNPTTSEALTAKWIIPLAEVRTCVALLFGCGVLKTRDTVVDPMHGLAAAMLVQSNADVVISTWREERYTPDGASLNPLINDVCAGVPVGEAVARYNSSPLGLFMGASFCVIGDPCIALDGATSFTRLSSPSVPATPVSVPGGDEGDRALLREVVANKLRSGQRSEDVDACERLEAILGGSQSSELSRADQTGALLARVFGAEFQLEDVFASLGTSTVADEEAVCPVCAGPAREYRFVFPAAGARPRRVTRCAACLESANVPDDWDVSLELSRVREGLVVIGNAPPDAHVRATILGYYGTVEASADWPALSSGGTTRELVLPASLDTGPAYCKLFIGAGLDFGSFGFKLRRFPNGTYASSALSQSRRLVERKRVR